MHEKSIFDDIITGFAPKLKFGSCLKACEKKFSKKFSEGGPRGGQKFSFFQKKIFFDKSCSESSETNFGIKKVNFEILTPGSILGSNFDPKGSIFSKFKILSLDFSQFKFEVY